MQKKSVATAFLLPLALGCSQGAVTALADDAHHTVVAGDAVKWGPAPPSLPSGAEAAVLLGNPGKEGPFVLRLKFPTASRCRPTAIPRTSSSR